MKVLKVYNKDSNLRSYGQNVFKATENLLATFPYEYGENYRKNLKDLEILYVDQFLDGELSGYYQNEANTIYFTDKNSVGHEMLHMASNDTTEHLNAFESKKGIEGALIEGMTEYFNVRTYGLMVPESYTFEVFCATMLDDIPGIFKPYFIPNDKEFIDLFPNKKDIYSLLYSLDVYHDIYTDFLAEDNAGKNPTINLQMFRKAVNDTVSALIDIKLSMESDPHMLRHFDYKLMEYVGSERFSYLFLAFYPKFYEYTDKLVDKKIRKKLK